MGHLRWAVSWLLVLAVGLAPILLYLGRCYHQAICSAEVAVSAPRPEDERLRPQQ